MTAAVVRSWAPAAGVLTLIGLVLAALAVFGGQTLPERTGPPIEELGVERTELTPGVIELHLRNTGPDPVSVAQVFVNDAYVDFSGVETPIERLGTATLRLDVPWQDGQPYRVSMLTSTGLVIEHEIPAAVATPRADGSFFGLMVLLGTYVGVIPVVLGMLFLPALRRLRRGAMQVLLAVTVGLLVFLAADAAFDGVELASAAGGAFGGPVLVVLGALLAYLALAAVDHRLSRASTTVVRPGGERLAWLIAVGIGLHNLGEGLAIGSAYAVGELALGVALVVGFAVHNTTEGLAIVAPLTQADTVRPPLLRLLGLGLLAGAPAIVGALVGATVTNPEVSAFLLGIGVGAIVQVVVQIAPSLRTPDRPALRPAVAGGVIAGVLAMYLTGLLVTV